MSPPDCARGAEARQSRGALAFRHSTAALAKALTPWLSFGPRFLELPGANGRTLPGASAASTSRTGHSAGRDDARSRPGAGLRAPPAGTAPRSASGSSLEGDVPVFDIRRLLSYSNALCRFIAVLLAYFARCFRARLENRPYGDDYGRNRSDASLRFSRSVTNRERTQLVRLHHAGTRLGRVAGRYAWAAALGLSWHRLSEQLFRVDKWSVCRG